MSNIVSSITFWDKDNFMSYADSDSMTDYFHSYSLGINHLIDWFIKPDGKDRDGNDWYHAKVDKVIKVDFGNNEELPKYFKRLEKLAKALSLKIKTVQKHSEYGGYKEFYLYDPQTIKEQEIITN